MKHGFLAAMRLDQAVVEFVVPEKAAAKSHH
jgi:hypothetical protein